MLNCPSTDHLLDFVVNINYYYREIKLLKKWLHWLILIIENSYRNNPNSSLFNWHKPLAFSSSKSNRASAFHLFPKMFYSSCLPQNCMFVNFYFFINRGDSYYFFLMDGELDPMSIESRRDYCLVKYKDMSPERLELRVTNQRLFFK